MEKRFEEGERKLHPVRARMGVGEQRRSAQIERAPAPPPREPRQITITEGVTVRDLAEMFNKPEPRRSEAFILADKAWDEDLGQLIVELDRTLSAKQRAHVVRRLSDYAKDFAVLAGEKEEAA